MTERQSDWIPAKDWGSAVDFVIDSFRDALVNKRLAPGDRVPSENELAATMQVSRSTVREAMKVLSAYGIIDIVRGNGTYISKSDENISMDAILFGFLLSQPSAREQLEFRALMERTVIEMVMNNLNDERIEALEKNYLELLSVVNDTEKSTENDIQFHKLLGEFTGNRLLARVYMFSITYFRASIESTHKNVGARGAVKVHRMTIDAIKKRDYGMIDAVVAENIKTWSSSSDKLYFDQQAARSHKMETQLNYEEQSC